MPLSRDMSSYDTKLRKLRNYLTFKTIMIFHVKPFFTSAQGPTVKKVTKMCERVFIGNLTNDDHLLNHLSLQLFMWFMDAPLDKD